MNHKLSIAIITNLAILALVVIPLGVSNRYLKGINQELEDINNELTKSLNLNMDSFQDFMVVKISSVSGNGTSMSPLINGGDKLLTSNISEYHVGDIINFNASTCTNMKKNYSFIIHRIVKIKDGRYITKGDNNKGIDKCNITIKDIKSKIISKLSN